MDAVITNIRWGSAAKLSLTSDASDMVLGAIVCLVLLVVYRFGSLILRKGKAWESARDHVISLNSVQLGEDFVSFTSATGRQTYPRPGLSEKHEGRGCDDDDFALPRQHTFCLLVWNWRTKVKRKSKKPRSGSRSWRKGSRGHGNLTVLKFAGMIAEV